MFGLLVKVVGRYVVNLGSIPSRSQVRQRSAVGQKLQILQICGIFKNLTIKSNFKVYRLDGGRASFQVRRFAVLAKAM